MGLVRYGHLDIGALLSCGRKMSGSQQQEEIWENDDDGDNDNDNEADDRNMIILITNDAARWSPDIAGPQTAYRLDRHLERRYGYGFIFKKWSLEHNINPFFVQFRKSPPRPSPIVQ